MSTTLYPATHPVTVPPAERGPRVSVRHLNGRSTLDIIERQHSITSPADPATSCTATWLINALRSAHRFSFSRRSSASGMHGMRLSISSAHLTSPDAPALERAA